MDQKHYQTRKEIRENTGESPGNSSIKSSKIYEENIIGDNKDETKNKHVRKQGDNKSNEPNKENKDDLKLNSVVPGEQDDLPDHARDKPPTVNNPQIKRNSRNVEMEPSSDTESQSFPGNTEEQVQNTPNIDTTVDTRTHVTGKEYITSNKPNEKRKGDTYITCTSQRKTGNENKTIPSFRGNTVELDSKPDQKQEQTNRGDIKSGNKKTSRLSNVVGCWRDELIVCCLVMMIVTLVFVLLVCFHYDKKIDNMNEELEKFRTELIKIQAEFKKPNPAIGTDTCLQNADTQKDVNTKIDTITRNVTNLNDTIKILGDKILTDKQNISTVLTETISLIRENDKRLSKELTSLNVSLTNTTQEHNSLKLEVDVLIDEVKRNISVKVNSLDQELEKLQNATKKADEIITQLEKDVEKIFPNTFNKDALTTAFGIVIVLVLGLYGYVFLYLRNATGVGRTGPTLMHNNSVAVLRQIPNNPALKNSVCIVSFDEQRCPIHRTLVTPACQGKDIKTFVVRQHASLLDMPRCRLYIMCAEFSERHVIIEQPNLGLGDLKRCTHDAVRKIGGELVILYTRDPGSRRLSDGQMFNRDIYCVNDQPELCALRDKGRFISLYDSLTPSQTRKLTETVEECLQ